MASGQGEGAPFPSSGDIVLLQEAPPGPPPAALLVRPFKTVLPGRGAGGEKSSEANGREPRPRNEGEDPLQGRALTNDPFDAELHGQDREPGAVTEPGVRATEQHTSGGSQRDAAWLILICVEPIYRGKRGSSDSGPEDKPPFAPTFKTPEVQGFAARTSGWGGHPTRMEGRIGFGPPRASASGASPALSQPGLSDSCSVPTSGHPAPTFHLGWGWGWGGIEIT